MFFGSFPLEEAKVICKRNPYPSLAFVAVVVFSIVMEWITIKLFSYTAVVIPMTGAFGGTHLKASDLLWGPHSIDHFVYYSNTKFLRFNSRI